MAGGTYVHACFMGICIAYACIHSHALTMSHVCVYNYIFNCVHLHTYVQCIAYILD